MRIQVCCLSCESGMKGTSISCVGEIFGSTWKTIKPFTYFLSPSRLNWSNSLSVTVFMGCWSHSNFSGSDTTWRNFRCFFFFFMEENWLVAEIKAGSAHRSCLVWLDCSIVHCSFWRICQSPCNHWASGRVYFPSFLSPVRGLQILWRTQMKEH